MANKYKVSVWDDRKIIEMVDGDGDTISWIFLIPLNCTLKIAKIVHFMVYKFYIIYKYDWNILFYTKIQFLEITPRR